MKTEFSRKQLDLICYALYELIQSNKRQLAEKRHNPDATPAIQNQLAEAESLYGAIIDEQKTLF